MDGVIGMLRNVIASPETLSALFFGDIMGISEGFNGIWMDMVEYHVM